jgi:amidase
MSELWQLGAGDLAGMIARREVSSAEVMDAHLARIDSVNPWLNALTQVHPDEARAAAVAADRAVADGTALGPLHGVPFTVKQNLDQVGCATNWGLVALAEAIAPVDAPVVERMRGAGAIPIGRSNCPDMALRVHTDSGLFGLTRNPWDPTRTAGGSSGGEASALASGMSPIGLGNDIGGSLRNPATCCGIASIKPSAGRVPSFALIPAPDAPASFQLMPVEGPMARRVADVRLGLEILAGPDRRDPYSVPAPMVSAAPAGRPLRVAVLADPPGGSTDPRVAGRVAAAGEALALAGYEVVAEGPPRFEETIRTWEAFLAADVRTMVPLIEPMMSDDANRFLANWLDTVAPVDLGGYTQVLMTRQSLMRDWSMWFADVDLVLTPAWTQVPFVHGWDAERPENAGATLALIRCVTPANLLGLPSACVPAGLVDGVPVGVLLTGERFADDKTLDAAAVVEAALGLDTPIDPIGRTDQVAAVR